MKTVFCRCTQCRYARKVKHVQAQIKRVQRSTKARVRLALARGDWDSLPTKVYAGYLG